VRGCPRVHGSGAALVFLRNSFAAMFGHGRRQLGIIRSHKKPALTLCGRAEEFLTRRFLPEGVILDSFPEHNFSNRDRQNKFVHLLSDLSEGI
jgi:hypothetical protein